MAIALQKAELFTVSIGENIARGKPDAPAGEITSAAKIAQADGFIRSTPEGCGTVVAERGMSLSAGQRQWLSTIRDADMRHMASETEIWQGRTL